MADTSWINPNNSMFWGTSGRTAPASAGSISGWTRTAGGQSIDPNATAAGYRIDPKTGRRVRADSVSEEEPPKDPYKAGQDKAAYISSMLGSLGLSLQGLQQAGGGGGGNFGMSTAQPIAPAPSAPDIGPIDTSASDRATFGRAKDVAGQTGRASLDSLRAVLGETGQLGGGAESQGVRDVVENAAGQVGEVNREQAIQGSKRAFETAQANQAAGIAQRGQNITSAVAQRGQDVQAQEAQARLAQQQANIQFQQQMSAGNRQLELLKMVLGQMNSAYSY